MRTLALGKKHVQDVKDSMSLNKMDNKNSFYNKRHSLNTIDKLKLIAKNRTYYAI